MNTYLLIKSIIFLSIKTSKNLNKGLMKYNIISYSNAGCELGESNAVRGGFTQHFNSSVRSHTEPVKKMFHKFVLICLFCWSQSGK